MILALEDHQFRIDSVDPDRRIELQRFRQGTAVILAGMDEQDRRLDVVDVFQRRNVPQFLLAVSDVLEFHFDREIDTVNAAKRLP